MKILFVAAMLLPFALSAQTTYVVTETGAAYYLDGNGPNPSIQLTTGVTYTFTASSLNVIHPFAISTSSSSVNVPAGVSAGSITGNESLTFTPASSGTYYYVCTNHFFFGQITVVDPPAITIDRVEYFFDADPGPGNGAMLPASAGADVLIQDSIDITGLSEGMHILYMRAKDSNGNWSIFQSSPIYKARHTPEPNLYLLETFVGQDPGLENGKGLGIQPNSTETVHYSSVALPGVEKGPNILYFRVRDVEGRWSLPFSAPFYNVGVERFKIASIDLNFTTPAGSKLTVNRTIPVTAHDVTETIDVDISTLDVDTNHVIIATATDESGKSSLPYTQLLQVAANTPPSAPYPAIPADGDTLATADSVLFAWTTSVDSDMDSVWYELSVWGGGIDTAFATVDTSYLAQGTGLFLVDSTYLWTVASSDTGGRTASPDTSRVHIALPPVVPSAPTEPRLMLPADKDTVTAADTVVFAWHSSFDPDPGPIYYVLRVFGPGVDSNFVAQTDTIAGLALSGLQVGQSYLWTVSATDSIFVVASPDTFSFFIPGMETNVISHGVIPDHFEMTQNYPNPFNPETRLDLMLPVNGHIRVLVYDLLGRTVERLMDEERPAGTYTVRWDARGLSSGTYFVRLRVTYPDQERIGEFVETRKVVLQR